VRGEREDRDGKYDASECVSQYTLLRVSLRSLSALLSIPLPYFGRLLTCHRTTSHLLQARWVCTTRSVEGERSVTERREGGAPTGTRRSMIAALTTAAISSFLRFGGRRGQRQAEGCSWGSRCCGRMHPTDKYSPSVLASATLHFCVLNHPSSLAVCNSASAMPPAQKDAAVSAAAGSPSASTSASSTPPRSAFRFDGSVIDTMLASALSGMIARIPLHPIDTCKAKLQVQQQLKSSATSTSSDIKPKSFAQFFSHTLRSEGVRGLYSGQGRARESALSRGDNERSR
jgi:hypothetical protein